MLIKVDASIYRDDYSVSLSTGACIVGIDSCLSPLLLLLQLLLVTLVFFAH
jgi:hypothetical protein